MRKISCIIYFFLPLLIVSFDGRAQCTFTSTAAGGLFTDPGTWTAVGVDCGSFPASPSIIVINGPVVLDTDLTLADPDDRLIINATGSLIEDGTPRTLTLGTGSGNTVSDRATVAAGGQLTVSQLSLTKSHLTVQAIGSTKGTTTVQCNLTIDNQGSATIDGAIIINGNLSLLTGNPLLDGNGSLLIFGCVTGTNGALQQAIQGNLIACVRNFPTVCATGTCNGDIPINNTANCALIDPPLPVELTWFRAATTSSGIQLTWQTASERNANEFQIERSTDGRTFGVIGQVAAAGTSTRTRGYSWQDDRPLAGTGFYRLKQVDEDGSVVFSRILTTKTTARLAALTLWPAATSGYYQLGPLTEPLTLTVITAHGRVVLTQTVAAGADAQLNLTGCPGGLYLVRAASAQSVSTTRLLHLQP